MQTKQFPLLYRPETEKLLLEKEINSIHIIQKSCIKAFLFLPRGYINDTFSDNYKNCLAGYWISFKNFLTEEQNAEYLLPGKKQWLESPEIFEDWISFSEVKTKLVELIALKKSPLVYKKTSKGIIKFFVVWW